MKEMIELLETASTACNNFIKSEMSLNDGDVEKSQKYSRDGQILVKALVNDTFKEIEEEIGENDGKTNDYDYPNNFELIRFLNEISMNVGGFLAVEDDENIKKIIEKKLLHTINTVKEIYTALYEN